MVVSAVTAAALLSPVSASAVSAPADGAPMDAALVAALAAASPTDELTVVASTGVAAPSSSLVTTLRHAGLDAVPYRHLPAVALRGTPAELSVAATTAGVTGLWWNAPLEATLAQSRTVVGAEQVQTSPELGFDGAGVAIAVLDSGIEATHADLAYPTKTIQNVKLLGNQHVFRDLTFTVEDVPNTDTTTGHGTHVAGIAAGDGTRSDGLHRGVASGASLVGLGAADGVEMLTALAGYDWLLANHARYGIRVLNNSWADGGITYDPAHPLNVASRRAADAGIVVVFAAGNGGKGGDTFNRYAFPDWVLSVGAVDKLGRPADYSSRGTAAHHADVVAPGTFIASTMATTGVVGVPNQTPFDLTEPTRPRVLAPQHVPFYTVKVGTSMAAPHVAGIAALVLEANPSLTAAEVRDVIRSSARPVAGCPVVDCGAGLVDAVGAVRRALALRAVAPVATLTASPASGAAPLTTTLDASGSTDADGTVVAWRWDLDGDGTVDATTASPTLAHSYAAGVWHPSVVAVDDDGLVSAPAVATLRASDPPVASASAPRHARSGVAVTFDASASHDPDGTVVSYTFRFGDGTEVTTSSPTVTHTYASARPVWLGWSVVVTDDAGLSDGVTGAIRVTP
ncbi:MAG: S8 family serine peptidase [Actinomycetes bacterium]